VGNIFFLIHRINIIKDENGNQLTDTHVFLLGGKISLTMYLMCMGFMMLGRWTYEGRLQSSGTHLITPSWNFVEVR
jgi:hypothetical protein